MPTLAELYPGLFGGVGPPPRKQNKPGLATSFKGALGSYATGVGRILEDEGAYDTGGAVRRYGEDVQYRNPSAVTNFEQFAESPWLGIKEAVGSGLGSTLPALVPYVGPVGRVLGGVGSTVAGGVISAVPAYGGIRATQDQTGEQDIDAARYGALASGAIEQVGGVQRLFRPGSGRMIAGMPEETVRQFTGSSPFRTGLRTAGRVGLGEGMEELAQGPIEQYAGGQDPREHLGETAFGGMQGFIGGLLPFGAMAGTRRGFQHAGAQDFVQQNPNNLDTFALQQQFGQLSPDQYQSQVAQYIRASIAEGLQAGQPVNLLQPHDQAALDALGVDNGELLTETINPYDVGGQVSALQQGFETDPQEQQFGLFGGGGASAYQPPLSAPEPYAPLPAGVPMQAMPHQAPVAPAGTEVEPEVSRAASIMQAAVGGANVLETDKQWAEQTLKAALKPKEYEAFLADLQKPTQTRTATAPAQAKPKAQAAPAAAASPFEQAYKDAGGIYSPAQKALAAAKTPEEALSVIRNILENKTPSQKVMQALEEVHKKLSGQTMTQYLRAKEAQEKADPKAPGPVTITKGPQNVPQQKAVPAGQDASGQKQGQAGQAPAVPVQEKVGGDVVRQTPPAGPSAQAAAARPQEVQAKAPAESARARPKDPDRKAVEVDEDRVAETQNFILQDIADEFPGKPGLTKARVLQLYLGWGEPRSLSGPEIQERMNISRQRVNQIVQELIGGGVVERVMAKRGVSLEDLRPKETPNEETPGAPAAPKSSLDVKSADVAAAGITDPEAEAGDVRRNTGFTTGPISKINSPNITGELSTTVDRETGVQTGFGSNFTPDQEGQANARAQAFEQAQEEGDTDGEAIAVWDSAAHVYVSQGQDMRNWDQLGNTEQGRATQKAWTSFYAEQKKVENEKKRDAGLMRRLRGFLKEKYYTFLGGGRLNVPEAYGEIELVSPFSNLTVTRVFAKMLHDHGSIIKERFGGFAVVEKTNAQEAAEKAGKTKLGQRFAQVYSAPDHKYYLIANRAMWDAAMIGRDRNVERAFIHEFYHMIDDAAFEETLFSDNIAWSERGGVQAEIRELVDTDRDVFNLFWYPVRYQVRGEPGAFSREMFAQTMSAYDIPELRKVMQAKLTRTYQLAEAWHETVKEYSQWHANETAKGTFGLPTEGQRPDSPAPARSSGAAQAIQRTEFRESFEAEVVRTAAGQLAAEDQEALEEAYGEDTRSLVDDVVQTLNGIRVQVSERVRAALQKLANALLAIVVAFNAMALTTQQVEAATVPIKSRSQVIQTVENPRADFADVQASADAKHVADWVVGTKDSEGKGFMVVDKPSATMYAFDANGQLLAAAPVLLGKAKGDTLSAESLAKSVEETTDAEKVTPAGRFNTEPRKGTLDFSKHEKSSYAIHRVYTGTPSEQRQQRLDSPSAEDNRISYGCINVGNEFYDRVLAPNYQDGAVTYILPDVSPLAAVFPGAGKYAPVMSVEKIVYTENLTKEQHESPGLPAEQRRSQRRAAQRRPEDDGEFKKGDVVTFHHPWLKDEETPVTGVIEEVMPDDGQVRVSYMVDGKSLSNVFSVSSLRKNLIDRQGQATTKFFHSAGLAEAITDYPAELKPSVNMITQAIKDQVTNWAKKGLQAVVFASDLSDIAVSEGLKSAKGFFDLLNAKGAKRIKMEAELDRIMTQAADLPDRTAVNKFLQTSTRSQRWGYKPTWKQDVEVDDAMAASYAALSPEGRKTVDEVFRYGENAYAETQRLVNKEINDEFDRREAAGEDVADARAKKLKAAGRVLPKLQGPYSPLKRFGDYVSVAKSEAYLDAEAMGDKDELERLQSDPNHYLVEFHDTIWEAKARGRQLQPYFSKAEGFEKQKAYRDVQEVPWGAIAKVKAHVEDMPDTTKHKSALSRLLNDIYLTMLAESSARKVELRRRGVHGEERDMLRSFASQGRASAHFIAALENNGPIQKKITEMQSEARDGGQGTRENRSRVFNEIMARYAQGLDWRPSPLTDKAMRLTSWWMLITSPAYYLQNATQPFMMTLPVLSGRFGNGAAWASLTKAYKDVGRFVRTFGHTLDIDKLPLADDEKAMLRQMRDSGRIDLTIAQDLGRWAAGETSGGVFGKVIRTINNLPHQVEMLNRITSALAAYRLSKGNFEYTARIVDQTHGNYAASNAPRFMHANSAARLITQFRKFQLIQMSLLARLAKDSFKGATPEERRVARAALTYILAQHLVMTGLLGMPLINIIGPIIAHAFGDDDEPKDFERLVRKAIGDEDIANLILRGVPASLGVDVSGRIGMGNAFALMPFTDIDLTSKKGLALTALGAMGPFIGGVLPNVAEGIGYMARGDYYKGLEMMAPRGLRDALRANRIATEGVTQKNNDVVLKPSEVSMLDVMSQAVGLPSTELQARQRRVGDVIENEQFYKDRTSSIKHKYAKAYRENDAAEMRELREEWAAVAAAMKRNGLKPQSLSNLLKAPQEQAKRERETLGGVPVKKSNREFVRQNAAL